MTILKKTTLPKNSILNSNHSKYDYVDGFAGMVIDHDHKFTSLHLWIAFFSSALKSPKWIERLFIWRNKIVSIFGLKTSSNMEDRSSQLKNLKGEKGEHLGLFKLLDRTENEIILGHNDKHLNFKISLLLGEQKSGITERELILSTIINFNNWFGRIYFIIIKPFHNLIVPRMLKVIISELENHNY